MNSLPHAWGEAFGNLFFNLKWEPIPFPRNHLKSSPQQESPISLGKYWKLMPKSKFREPFKSRDRKPQKAASKQARGRTGNDEANTSRFVHHNTTTSLKSKEGRGTTNTHTHNQSEANNEDERDESEKKGVGCEPWPTTSTTKRRLLATPTLPPPAIVAAGAVSRRRPRRRP